MIIVVDCVGCNEEKHVDIPTKAWVKWKNSNVSLQVVWPEGSANDRELLISQLCGTCYDEWCGFDYEDEETYEDE